jgi:hypothetical protein
MDLLIKGLRHPLSPRSRLLETRIHNPYLHGLDKRCNSYISFKDEDAHLNGSLPGERRQKPVSSRDLGGFACRIAFLRDQLDLWLAVLQHSAWRFRARTNAMAATTHPPDVPGSARREILRATRGRAAPSADLKNRSIQSSGSIGLDFDEHVTVIWPPATLTKWADRYQRNYSLVLWRQPTHIHVVKQETYQRKG